MIIERKRLLLSLRISSIDTTDPSETTINTTILI